MQEIAERYIATWNETDPGLRRGLIDSLWAADASYTDPLADVHGRADIDATIAAVQQQFPGLVFRLGGPVDANHNQALHLAPRARRGRSDRDRVRRRRPERRGPDPQRARLPGPGARRCLSPAPGPAPRPRPRPPALGPRAGAALIVDRYPCYGGGSQIAKHAPRAQAHHRSDDAAPTPPRVMAALPGQEAARTRVGQRGGLLEIADSAFRGRRFGMPGLMVGKSPTERV